MELSSQIWGRAQAVSSKCLYPLTCPSELNDASDGLPPQVLAGQGLAGWQLPAWPWGRTGWGGGEGVGSKSSRHGAVWILSQALAKMPPLRLCPSPCLSSPIHCGIPFLCLLAICLSHCTSSSRDFGRDFGFPLHNQHGALLTTKQCGPEVGALGFGLPSVQRNDQKNMSASAQFGLGPVRGRGVLTRWRCLAPSSPPSCPGPGARGRAPCCGLSPICAHLQASLPSRAGPRSYEWSLRGQEPDLGNVEPPP